LAQVFVWPSGGQSWLPPGEVLERRRELCRRLSSQAEAIFADCCFSKPFLQLGEQCFLPNSFQLEVYGGLQHV
jgi:hypothetical protein